MEAESVEVHCWTLQIDKVKMYGWSVKVLYLFIYLSRLDHLYYSGFPATAKMCCFFQTNGSLLISATIKHFLLLCLQDYVYITVTDWPLNNEMFTVAKLIATFSTVLLSVKWNSKISWLLVSIQLANNVHDDTVDI